MLLLATRSSCEMTPAALLPDIDEQTNATKFLCSWRGARDASAGQKMNVAPMAFSCPDASQGPVASRLVPAVVQGPIAAQVFSAQKYLQSVCFHVQTMAYMAAGLLLLSAAASLVALLSSEGKSS